MQTTSSGACHSNTFGNEGNISSRDFECKTPERLGHSSSSQHDSHHSHVVSEPEDAYGDEEPNQARTGSQRRSSVRKRTQSQFKFIYAQAGTCYFKHKIVEGKYNCKCDLADKSNQLNF